MEKGVALLIVDVQKDFCPGGNLAVPGGDEIVPVLNRYIGLFRKRGWPVFASRDWHPPESGHFRASGGVWPEHCVQGSEGASFHPGLGLPEDAIIVSKGMNPAQDGYSCFDAINGEGRGLRECLTVLGIGHLCVGGLATDYCVRSSVLDALRSGFRVTLLLDAIRGVDLQPGDSEAAIREMVEAGASTACRETLETDRPG